MKNRNQLLDTIQTAQKTMIKKINEIASNEDVRRTAKLAHDYGQRMIARVAKELEKQGKLTAHEAKKLLKEVTKRSANETVSLQKSIRNDSDKLLKSTKNVIINSLALAKKTIDTSANNTRKKKRNS